MKVGHQTKRKGARLRSKRGGGRVAYPAQSSRWVSPSPLLQTCQLHWREGTKTVHPFQAQAFCQVPAWPSCNVSWALRQKGKHQPSAFLFETNSEQRTTAPRKLKPTVCSERAGGGAHPGEAPSPEATGPLEKVTAQSPQRPGPPSAVTQAQGLVWDLWK